MDSHYDTLGLEQTASFDEVKVAYRRLAQRYHPDKNVHDPVRSAEMFTRVRLAYEALISPETRRQHDDELARHASFEAELERRRNAYAHAGAYASGAAGDAASSGRPTNWHARAWELVQRDPGVDALARALRSEGCLPSLAAPLARDVAREFEQLKQARANFQAGPGPGQSASSSAGAAGAAGAYRSAQASANAADTAQSAAQAGAAASRAQAAADEKRAADAGTARRAQTRGPFRETVRPSVFETRRRASPSSSNARYGWIIVAAMALVLIWRYVPSTRVPGLRTMSGHSRYDASDAFTPSVRRQARDAEADTDNRMPDRDAAAAADERARNRRLLPPSDSATIERLLPGLIERRDATQSDRASQSDDSQMDDSRMGRIGRPQAPDAAPVMPQGACAPNVDRIGCRSASGSTQ